jgi:hypothetical protein
VTPAALAELDPRLTRLESSYKALEETLAGDALLEPRCPVTAPVA